MALADRSYEEALAELTVGLRIIALRALGDRDAVEDAVQETFVRVLAALRTKGLPAGYSLESYVYGTMRHVIGDVHRRRKRFISLSDWLIWRHDSPLDELVEIEETEHLIQALRKLDKDDRVLLERCYLNGEKLVDIARSLDEPPERVRKRKSRALQRLREAMPNWKSHTEEGPND